MREDGEPTRRRASRSEFSDEEWRLVSELADHPNRLLVTATPEGGETYAEVAHEAIFRRWDKLREWIAAEREFLAWRSGLEAARHAWQSAPDKSKGDALLMGFALTQAQRWYAKRAKDIPAADCALILQSRKAAQLRKLRVQALVGVLGRGDGRGLSRLVEPRLVEGTILCADECAPPQDSTGTRAPAEGLFQRVHRLPRDDCCAGWQFHDGLARDRKGPL